MSGFVYFIVGKSGDELICKIGYTGRSPQSRIRDLQPCSPVDLDIFGYVIGDQRLEQKFHRTFAPLRLHGEWFHAVHKLHDFIWRLAFYGSTRRPVSQIELDAAIYDTILSDTPPGPEVDRADWLNSAVPAVWIEVANRMGVVVS